MEKFIRNNRLISSELDDFQVMMVLEKGKYFGLTPVGKRIWELIESPQSLQEIADVLMTEYEVTEIQCRQEVEDFLVKALQNDLILKYEPVE